MYVADRVEGRTTVTLLENGEEKLLWRLDGTTIAGSGRDLRQLSAWKQELPAREAERATLMRRAVFVSGARQWAPPEGELTAYQSRERMGVCFNYQLPQAKTSTRTPDWHRDFSMTGRIPLDGPDLDAEFDELAAR